MSNIWVGIRPGSLTTRVLAMAGAGEMILKARLSPSPSHPRALPTLLEAVVACLVAAATRAYPGRMGSAESPARKRRRSIAPHLRPLMGQLP